jgi:hypothetical protein
MVEAAGCPPNHCMPLTGQDPPRPTAPPRAVWPRARMRGEVWLSAHRTVMGMLERRSLSLSCCRAPLLMMM